MATPANLELKAIKVTNLRDQPANSGTSRGQVKVGSKYTAFEVSANGSYYHLKENNYWATTSSFEITKNNGGTSTKKVTSDELKPNVAGTKEYDVNLSNINQTKYSEYLNANMQITNMQIILGAPYGYTNLTDRKVSANSKKDPDNVSNGVGWIYGEKIVSQMPLLVLTPCRPSFLSGIKQSDRSTAFTEAYGVFTGMRDAVPNFQRLAEKLTNDNDIKYYTAEFDYVNYYGYLNTMLRMMANWMNVGDVVYNGKRLNRYDWTNHDSHATDINKIVTGGGYHAYYIESDTQISENFSNSTGDSTLASTMNSMSDYAKEVQFFFGAGAGVDTQAVLDSVEGAAPMEALNKIFDKYSNPGNFISRIKEGVGQVVGGGKLIFPEIWKESGYVKDYDVTLKLVSPDGDNLSIYLNIFVPMFHLLALTLPRQSSANGYYSPFLVRGFYKSFFNIDMGMITNLSINKGAEGSWNVNGLPTEMTIEFTIKDMYQAMAMTHGNHHPVMLLRNTQYMDFIANMAGINLNKIEISRTIEYYKTWGLNYFEDIATDAWRGLQESLDNYIQSAAEALML